MKLTRRTLDEAIAKLAAGNRSRELIWDAELGGFGARLTKRGVTFFIDYRGEGGKQRRMTIGALSEVTPEAARRRAMELKVSIRSGTDPLQAKRRAAKAVDKLTVEEISTRWLADGASRWRPRTANDYKYTLSCHILPAIGQKAAAEVSKADVSGMVAKVRESSPAVAGKVLRTVSAMLRWAEDLELLEEAKLPRVKRTAPPVPARERLLADSEIRKIWAAADTLSPEDAGFVRLVILTVIRSGAAEKACRIWLKGDTLEFPAAVMKGKRSHKVPIAAWAADLISPKLDGGGRLANPILREVRRLTGIKDFTWHDMRRSFRTWCAANGITRDHAEVALAHVSHQTALDKAYDKHSYEAEAAKVLKAWQDRVRAIVS